MTTERITRIPLPPANADAAMVAWMRTVAEALNSILINYNEDGDVVIDGEVMEGGIVTLDGTQTLTNKTLTTPTLEGPTLNDPVTFESPIPIADGGTGLSVLGDPGQLLAVDGAGTAYEHVDIAAAYSQETVAVTLGVDTDDLVIADDTTLLLLSSAGGAGGVQLKGLAGGVGGRKLLIRAITTGAHNVVITEEDAGSVAANRFFIPLGTTVTLAAATDTTAEFVYDSVQQRWVHLYGGTVA